MRTTKTLIRRMMCTGTLSIAILMGLLGCNGAVEQIKQPPTTSRGESKNLKQLTRDIAENQKEFASLSADCKVLIKSPLLPRRRPQLELEGELNILKPRKVHLKLYATGQVAVRLVGDGKKYQVSLPIFDDAYGGEYGSSITSSSDRLHFMPDDLVDALDLQSLLHGRPQVLKSYPKRWEIAPGSLKSPVTYPPVWMIDSLDVTSSSDANVANSIMIDRRNENVLRIDKFRDTGELRTRMWHMNTVPIQGPEGASANLPRNILIWYPPPLEGTMIHIKLEDIKLNVPMEESDFQLGG